MFFTHTVVLINMKNTFLDWFKLISGQCVIRYSRTFQNKQSNSRAFQYYMNPFNFLFPESLCTTSHSKVSHSSHNGYNLNSHLTCFWRGFIAQMVEHCTGITEVMGLNPIGASDFFLGFSCNCLSYFTTAKIFHIYSLSAIHSYMYDLYHIHFSSKVNIALPQFLPILQTLCAAVPQDLCGAPDHPHIMCDTPCQMFLLRPCSLCVFDDALGQTHRELN